MSGNVIFLTNIPAPYREKLHEIVYGYLNQHYSVIYCARREPNRDWDFPYGVYKKHFLAERGKGFIHNNWSVLKLLTAIDPEIVITTGFYPTTLYAFCWCMLHKKKHVVFSDGTLGSEKTLTGVHRLLRKIILAKSKASIGASEGSKKLFLSYNVPLDKIFKSCLCVDNSLFKPICWEDKCYDLMFSGQIIDRKMPLFFVEIAKLVRERLGTCKVLLVGNGDLKHEMLRALKEHQIDHHYAGFIDPHLLPDFYSAAKIFLFPTKRDPWGIVANEAMASGVPVITSEHAGVANDLVLNNINGFVLPLQAEVWATKVIELFKDRSLYCSFSKNALAHVKKYNYVAAAKGIIEAVEFVAK